MASVKVAMEGLDELRAGLRKLPADLNRKARDRVIGAANGTASELGQAYDRSKVSGNMRRGIKVKVEETATTTTAEVRSTSPHAHLWEFGTQVRRTQQGFNRGAAPAHHDQGIVGIAQRRRRGLNAGLADIVREAGFEVTGE
jgi:hypothetical protein